MKQNYKFNSKKQTIVADDYLSVSNKWRQLNYKSSLSSSVSPILLILGSSLIAYLAINCCEPVLTSELTQQAANYQVHKTDTAETIKVGNSKTSNFNFQNAHYTPTQLTQVVLNMPKIKKLRSSRPPTVEEYAIKQKIVQIYELVKNDFLGCTITDNLNHLGRIIQALNPKYIATERVSRATFSDPADPTSLIPLPDIKPEYLYLDSSLGDDSIPNQLELLNLKFKETFGWDENFIVEIVNFDDDKLTPQQLAFKRLLMCLTNPALCDLDLLMMKKPVDADLELDETEDWDDSNDSHDDENETTKKHDDEEDDDEDDDDDDEDDDDEGEGEHQHDEKEEVEQKIQASPSAYKAKAIAKARAYGYNPQQHFANNNQNYREDNQGNNYWLEEDENSSVEEGPTTYGQTSQQRVSHSYQRPTTYRQQQQQQPVRQYSGPQPFQAQSGQFKLDSFRERYQVPPAQNMPRQVPRFRDSYRSPVHYKGRYNN